jgi:ADP-heptose:LPS heptosyltransferase
MRGAPSDLADRTHVSVAASAPGENAVTSYRSIAELGRHDLLFDLTETARSRWISVVNQANLKVGFVRSNFGFLLSRFIYDVLVPRTDHKFEAETFLDQLLVFGVNSDWPPDFGIERASETGKNPVVLYFPTASHREKCWDAGLFSQLLGSLSTEFRHGRHVVLAGIQKWEQKMAADIANPWLNSSNVEMRSAGPGDLDLIRDASLLISGDTGLRNYAIAAGTPTLGIFWLAPPYRYQPRFGDHRVVFSPDGSVPSLQQVLEVARKMLEGLVTKPSGQTATSNLAAGKPARRLS